MRVRPATRKDAPALADLLDRAWRRTYAAILPDEVLNSRNRESDADDLADLADMGRLLVAEGDSAVVGLASFGSPNHLLAEGVVEVYACYLDPNSIGIGSRLLLRTIAEARRSGGEELVWYMHESNPLRSRVEQSGRVAREGPLDRSWFGHPVKVYEYRWPLRPSRKPGSPRR